MTFRERVYQATQAIPYGRVTAYKHIALLAGNPAAPRQVGQALSRLGACEDQVPWYRVVNAVGIISIRGQVVDKSVQKQLLEAEGVTVSEDFQIDLTLFGWFEVPSNFNA